MAHPDNRVSVPHYSDVIEEYLMTQDSKVSILI